MGGGISGAVCARSLRKLAPEIEVVVIERNPGYVSGPSRVDHVVGLENVANMTVGFGGLMRDGGKIIRAVVTAIRPAENRLITSMGSVDYNILVVATGMVPAEDEIVGLLENSGLNQHAWTWPGTIQLKRTVEGFGGGAFVLNVPPPPYSARLALMRSPRSLTSSGRRWASEPRSSSSMPTIDRSRRLWPTSGGTC
ncbi:MAG: FAD/NAD(P)-binding oxidoreductase [Armatimonadota bacterium]|nr:FAD/NAD(P)-binding oxidoreductase [Armatimonadota bacterium]MDR7427709.1 FAD/NAD(P)-binding oxidoreductase [Armatimonadota bacterium]MDR7469620.1 FAD/NAD(P)-binding oxidoreductase [Armatimonadota bacterium]MDR7474949.1 FAD/NAD(P)-binding oxidoreductase [Armatimonadota bacterium]MDR7538339.1 FAD/NAD(P)-binding oxidoreductase [Armatimonadota bacterium]